MTTPPCAPAPRGRMRRRVAATAAALLAGLALTGCGGSGGGGDSREPGPTQPAASASPGGDETTTSVVTTVLSGGGPGGDVAFEQTVYPLLRQYCATCHAGPGPGFPDIAHPDPGTAYREVVDNQKVNLSQPTNSRLVQRLVTDLHHCWTTCDADGATMTAAIGQWVALVFPAGDPNGVLAGGTPGAPIAGFLSSDVRTLASATRADSGRHEQNVIALWKFEEGAGETAFDSSGIVPGIDLTLTNATWLSGGGVDFQNGRGIATAASSRKLYNLIASGSGSQQYTIEAWVVPANTTQEGPARIVSYSDGTARRNFTMGQRLYNYVFRNRALVPGITENGTPDLETADADEDLQATLQHAVMTFDQVNGRRIWVNGRFTDDVDPLGPGLLVSWSPDYRFVLANETTNSRPWAGQMKLVAIHDRALTPEQILQNYLAGAGQKFILRFGLDDALHAGAYIEFEVSEFDAYSYLFCFPVLGTPEPSGFPVEKIRIAVNGVAPVQSQSFRNVSAIVDEPREPLSGLCGVVPKDLGMQSDQFAIFFEVLGANQNLVVEAPPTPPVDDSVAPPLPDSGIRSFAQINDTMAAVTGVDPATPTIRVTFGGLTQQLPGSTDLRSFVSSHQVAISKLALEYCDALVESTALRAALFGSQFQFDAPVTTALAGPAERDLIIDALIDRMIGANLLSQPTSAEVRPLLNGLIDDLTLGCSATTCDATRTRTVVKAACAAVLSSGALHIH